ncbi:MAG: hypothetical protein C0168_10650 [Candidatus Aminicenantes bacterium]|nr:MAG: hypothetical protein C0168_10650 [Candidatus Aminicenantes bacterium]
MPPPPDYFKIKLIDGYHKQLVKTPLILIGGLMADFELKQLLPLYGEIGILKYGGTLNFNRLEKLMEPVRLGQEEFTLKHLEILTQDPLSPAWWKLPELNQAEIEPLKWAFKFLQPREETVIQKAFALFKNIEVLSCLLRVICPRYYGIYSAPVEISYL